MKIIEDIKKKIEEMKTEENKYKVYDKNIDGNVDKLIKSLKNELSDISRNVKISEEKMENFFKTYNKNTVVNSRVDDNKSKIDDQNLNFQVKDLKKKNDNLISELSVLKDNFNDVRKQNYELKDKFVTNENTYEKNSRNNNKTNDTKINRQQHNSVDIASSLIKDHISPEARNETFYIKSLSDKVNYY